MKTCCFFGHRDIFVDKSKLHDLICKKVEQLLKLGFSEFLFGGYGDFDSACYIAVKSLKPKFPSIKTIYVQAYYKPHEEVMQLFYDEILFPEIEDKPLRFAISYRNRKMIDMSDFCIFFVKNNHGGAYEALKYAKRKKKNFQNLSNEEV